MNNSKRFHQLACLAAFAVAATNASAFSGSPNGVWAGTIRCSGVAAESGSFSGTATATMSVSGSLVVVYDGWTQPYIVYAGFYVADDADPANKGTLGLTDDGATVNYSENGQLRLEHRKDGKATLDGKSYAIRTVFETVLAACDWKFEKKSDVPLPSPSVTAE